MKINSVRVALTFAGCFLGAGYVSGQELWQFFVSFGPYGILGMIGAMILIFLFGVLLLRLACESKIFDCDKLIIRAENRFLRAFIAVSEMFFLVGIAVIMTAGVGALFEQVLSFSKYITSALFAVLVFVLSLGGHKRMVSVFSLTVPLVVLFTVVVCIVSVVTYGFPDIAAMKDHASSGSNPLLSSWWISAVTFVCYNLFSSVQILAPVGVLVDSKKKVIIGVFLGVVFLLLVSGCIFVSMAIYPECSQAPLPMLYAAERLSSVLGFIYSVLLFFGMLGTCLSSVVAVTHFAVGKIGKNNLSLPVSLIICIVSYVGSLVGFGELIGTVYPLCGYLGVLAIAAITEHYLYIRRKNRKNKNNGAVK